MKTKNKADKSIKEKEVVAVEEKPLFTGFKVDYKSYSEETSKADPEDGWSRASTSSSHEVNGISITKDKNFDVIGAFVADDTDENYHLVAVIYSTGDSFGRDENARIEFVEVFKTLDKAEKCVEQINLNNELYKYKNNYHTKKTKEELKEIDDKLLKKVNFPKDSYDYSFCFKDESDTVRFSSAPWNGYFESLSSVEIYTSNINKVYAFNTNKGFKKK